MLRTLLVVIVSALAFSPATSSGARLSSFDRFVDRWNRLHDYSVRIQAHESLGQESADNEMLYRFRKPDRARLDVMAGPKAGSTIVWSGGERVTAYKRSLSIFKMHGNAHQKDLTSLRGNGILAPNMGLLATCFGAHRDALVERPGPVVEGDPTTEVELPYKGIICPEDPAVDRGAITLDVLDVSDRTGLVLVRKRYAGEEIVERWQLNDYKLDAGLGDGDLR